MARQTPRRGDTGWVGADPALAINLHGEEPRDPGSGHPLPVPPDRAHRTLRGIDEQVAKAQRAVDGHAPVKRNRYIQLCGATKSVNRTLEAKTRAQAGWKGYTTNLTTESAQFVIDAY